MNFKQTIKFGKELKKLSTKYQSLNEDLETFKRLIKTEPLGVGRHAAVLYKEDNLYIVKARLFCKTLKSSSLRLIYAYNKETGNVELIEFIELYSKVNKDREDQERIKIYIKSLL